MDSNAYLLLNIVIFYHGKRLKGSVCKVSDTQHGKIINAEFSLQRPSQNSHVNNQRQSWSQIREF